MDFFKYLGRLMTFDDNDAQALARNIKKACQVWTGISKVLRLENADPGVY